MPIFSKESLETLRQRIDLVEVISPHVDLHRSGVAFKGLCPFHDEKTPSFMIQKGDLHYHCFGCGAHGDAIQFLMFHLKMNFTEAVESLAEKFQVHLEVVEGKSDYEGPSKKSLKEALGKAARFFHFYLMHTPEGHEAASYLFKRKFYTEFIQQFQIGLAPKHPGMLRKYLHSQGINDEMMLFAGLISQKSRGEYKDFFSDRITLPIQDPMGAVIGFSARKFNEDTYGGKYVNTADTPLFKKSRVLYGLNHCRRRIAKERKVIIVEGQLDALRLIHGGFDFTVAGQGTAFGEGHVQELMHLGVCQVYLCLDSDEAGREATAKIGNLFQKEGAEVNVITLPQGSDPDSFMRDEGSEMFKQLLEKSTSYLDYLVTSYSQRINITSPAGKNELVQTLVKQIRSWKHSLMVHESLKKVANLLQIPEHIVGVGQEYIPNIHIRKSASIGLQSIDPIRILESDFLRWLLIVGGKSPQIIKIAMQNVKNDDLQNPLCKRLYQTYLQRIHSSLHCDLLSLIQEEEDQELLASLMDKKVNIERAEEHFIETVQKILDRNWMEKREEIKRKIQSGQCREEEAITLLKEFDDLKKMAPKVILPITP